MVNHTFQKQSTLSQFEIVNTNGRQKLSIPTIKATRKGFYNSVEIDYSTNWQVEHWRSIENAYLKSPFYLYYGYKIEGVFKNEYKSLLDFNLAVFKCIKDCIKQKSALHIDEETSLYFEELKESNNSVYPQVFDTKLPFEENLTILDLLFNLGPETLDYLKQAQYKTP
jgi:hypothetical protein